MWLVLLLVAVGAPPDAPAPAAESKSAPVPAVRGCAIEARSANFKVLSRANNAHACEVARMCEAWRSHLQTTWCGTDKTQVWNPKCEVIVHDGKSVVLPTGTGQVKRKSSSSLIDFKEEKVKSRRIEFVAERDGSLAALPPEVTRIVLADLFGGRMPPRWADEGIALLAESDKKQKVHQQALQAAFNTKRHFSIADLVQLRTAPSPDRAAVFQGQSASLASFLVRHDRPEKFVKFIARALDQGYDQALRDIYTIDGVAELERLWTADREGAVAFHGLRLTLDDGPIERPIAK